jgi:outer membrane receptor protein involved in Fe transport
VEKGGTPLQADLPPAVDTVIVSAARLPAPASDAAFSIVRIEADQIVLSPRLDEALKQIPSLSLFRRTTSLAANPTTQGVSLRAIAPSGAGRTLVTLDGVPQNDPFGGWVIWSSLPNLAIDGIAVVRGAGAGPYGAGALTGTVALDEAVTVDGFAAEVAAGERASLRGAAVADAALGAVGLFVVASGERGDGWVPVREGRGSADAPLHLATWQTAARLQADIRGGVLALRAQHYDDDRGSGLDGGGARARGDAASITYAAPPEAGAPGWRAQIWLRETDLRNFTTAPMPDRSATTPANDQYATPALGWGANAALRRETPHWEWEIGADARFADGETREHFRFIAPDFTRNRVAGGANIVAGAYGEASWRNGPWLIAGGARADFWSSRDAHRVERDLATDVATLAISAPDRDGIVPTARAGVRRQFAGDLFARVAAYLGFRPPTLNELHRPFRVANDITEANPLLKPEKLYGVEAALGAGEDGFSWQATVFYNVLKDPVTNVTIATTPGIHVVHFGPESFPALVPDGGALRQRQNAGRIDAFGLEAEIAGRWGDDIALRLAANVTSARVDGGDVAPQLTGNRPAQAPRVAVTGGADWRPTDDVVLHANLRFESMRFDDDLNTRRLDAALTANVRAVWRISDALTLYGEAMNVTDARVETARTADGIASLDQPRTFWIGLTYSR